MRWIWSLLVAVVLAGAAAILWPGHEGVETAPETASATPSSPMPAPTAAPQVPSAVKSGSAEPARDRAGSPAPSTSTVRVDRQPDGTLLLDGRFMMTGSGSEQDPFVISWPLLFSASESIDSAADRLTPPPHIGFLNGQWVQISGFLAPPLWGEQTAELLVMKNRWDGCCIGLPPTPFDCIEATLAQPIKLGAKHSVSFGTVSGRLIVEPFRAGAFLIGLYRLEGARVAEMKGS